MEALNDYMIVRKDEVVRTTPSGLILAPEPSVNEGGIAAPYTGVVLSVGSEVKGGYAPGDRVAFSDMSSPYVLDDDGAPALVLPEESIVAVLSD